MYIYYDTDGQVKMRSETPIKTKLKQAEVLHPDKEKLEQNYILKYKNRKLKYEKPDHVIKEDKRKQIDELLETGDKKDLKKVIKMLLE